MKLQEVFDKCGVESDAKARRVANVAPDQTANITADEIENGVTIERLESIGVPVLKYAGQITIHGRLPEFSDTARPGGYKAVFQNQNGSVGVRYVALDAAKKKQIVEACRYKERGSTPWSASLNSKGLEIIGFWHEKADCVTAFQSFPRSLFAGGITAGAGMFGGYYVIVAIGTVYEADLWPLISHCFGFACAADLETVKEAHRIEHERQAAQYAKQRAEREATEAAKRGQMSASIGLAPLKALPKGECAFVRICDSLQGPRPLLYVVRKKAFGQLCYATRQWQSGLATFEPVGKMKRFDADRRAAIERSIKDGLVFHPLAAPVE